MDEEVESQYVGPLSAHMFLIAISLQSSPQRHLKPTFTNNQLIFWPSGMRENVVCFDHGCSLPICNGYIVCSRRRISGGRR
jgi:hypothetical protein